MAKKKTPQQFEEPYVSKPDNKLYLYIQVNSKILTPIPYKWKPNYLYIKNILIN